MARNTLQSRTAHQHSVRSVKSIFCVQEGRLWRSLEQPEGAMKCGMCMSLAFLEPGDGDGGAVRAVGGYEDGSVAVWDAAGGSSPLAVVKVQGEPVMAVSVHGRGGPLHCHLQCTNGNDVDC